MWEKVKAFFAKDWVKITEVVLMLVLSIGLLIGGVEVAEIESIPQLAGSIVAGILAIVAFFKNFVSKK